MHWGSAVRNRQNPARARLYGSQPPVMFQMYRVNTSRIAARRLAHSRTIKRQSTNWSKPVVRLARTGLDRTARIGLRGNAVTDLQSPSTPLKPWGGPFFEVGVFAVLLA